MVPGSGGFDVGNFAGVELALKEFGKKGEQKQGVFGEMGKSRSSLMLDEEMPTKKPSESNSRESDSEKSEKDGKESSGVMNKLGGILEMVKTKSMDVLGMSPSSSKKKLEEPPMPKSSESGSSDKEDQGKKESFFVPKKTDTQSLKFEEEEKEESLDEYISDSEPVVKSNDSEKPGVFGRAWGIFTETTSDIKDTFFKKEEAGDKKPEIPVETKTDKEESSVSKLLESPSDLEKKSSWLEKSMSFIGIGGKKDQKDDRQEKQEIDYSAMSKENLSVLLGEAYFEADFARVKKIESVLGGNLGKNSKKGKDDLVQAIADVNFYNAWEIVLVGKLDGENQVAAMGEAVGVLKEMEKMEKEDVDKSLSLSGIICMMLLNKYQIGTKDLLYLIENRVITVVHLEQMKQNGFDFSQAADLILIMAAQTGDVAVVRWLSKLTSFNINVQDGDGNTALHLAAKMGHRQIAGLFLALGANIEAKNKNNELADWLTNDNLIINMIRQVRLDNRFN